MTPLSSFRKSGYCKAGQLIKMAIISAFCVVFYTTKNSLLYSFQLRQHIEMFLFSVVLFCFAACIIAYVVFRLDSQPLHFVRSTKRWFIQAFLLGFFLPFLCLQLVYGLYSLLFDYDLRHTEYFERDFVVVISCLLGMQVYFKLKYEYMQRRSLEEERENLLAQLFSLQTANSEVEESCRELRSKEKTLTDKLLQVEKNETIWRSFVQELRTPFHIYIQGIEESIIFGQVREFYINEENKKMKNTSAILMDGREGMLEFPSLKAIEQQFPHSAFRITRDNLVPYLWIQIETGDNDQHQVKIMGTEQEPIAVSSRKQRRLMEVADWYHSFSGSINRPLDSVPKETGK